jgi:hypothetical protein
MPGKRRGHGSRTLQTGERSRPRNCPWAKRTNLPQYAGSGARSREFYRRTTEQTFRPRTLWQITVSSAHPCVFTDCDNLNVALRLCPCLRAKVVTIYPALRAIVDPA